MLPHMSLESSSLARASFAGAFVALLASACGSAPEAKPQAAAEQTSTSGSEEAAAARSKEDASAAVRALLAREVEAIPVREFKTGDDSVSGAMESSTDPVVTVQEGYIQVNGGPLGGGPVQCFIYPESKDPGALIQIMVEATLTANKAIVRHQWVHVRAGQSSGWPYVLAQAHYLVDTPEGAKLGDYKIAASSKSETTVVCLHDVPGYLNSFERVFAGFTGSLDTASNRADVVPLRSSITRTGIGNRIAGIARHERFEAEGGGEVLISSTVSLSIGPDGSLKSDDSAESVTVRDGIVQSGTYALATRGELDYELELTRTKTGYHVVGTVQGKQITAEIPMKDGIADSDTQDAQACQIMAGKVESVSAPSYEPSMNPVGITTLEVTRSKREGYHLAADIGGLQMHMEVDADCDMIRGIADLGPVTMTVQRLWKRVDGKTLVDK